MSRLHLRCLPRALRRALSGLPLLGAVALSAHAATTADTAPSPQQATTLKGVQASAKIVKDSDSVTKTDTPIVAIPQSVSVIKIGRASCRERV